MLDFDKQLPPSAVEKEELLLQITRDHIIAGLDEEVAGIVHLHVLLHPVRQVSEENLEGKTTHIIANFIRRKWRRTGCTRLTCAYTLGVLRLAEHALSVLQPGLESRHAAGVLLPVGDHLLQHAAHAAHLQGQVLPLHRGVVEEFTHPLDFVDWKQEDTFSIQQMVTRDNSRWVTRRLGLMLQRIGKSNLSEHSSRCNYCYFCHASSNVMIVFVLFFRWKKVKGLLRKSAVPHSQKGGAQEMEKKKKFLRLSGSFFRLTSVTGFRPCNMKLIIKTSSKISL